MKIVDVIKSKAFGHIDEVFPEHNDSTIDAPFSRDRAFGIDELIIPALRESMNIVPHYLLGGGVEQDTDNASYDAKTKVAKIKLNKDFGKMILTQCSDWTLPVFATITVTSPIFAQSANKILMGSPCRPKVFVTSKDGYALYYTTATGEISELRYFPISDLQMEDTPQNEIFCPKDMREIVAWKVAEAIAMQMNDNSALQIITAKIEALLKTM